LQVTTALLQDIHIPVFERAVILGVRQSDITHQFIGDVWFPVNENFPEDIFHTWLKLSHELIQSALSLLKRSDEVERFYQKFHHEYVVKWSSSVHGGKSTVPILQSAFQLGIPFRHLGNGRYLLGWGAKSYVFDRSSHNLDSAFGAWASQRKDITIQIMRQSGIPVPKGESFDSNSTIHIDSLTGLRRPLVVKPVDRDRGEGVTLSVTNDTQFQMAIQTVRQLSKAFLVEEQVEGTCHRVFVADGKLIYVVKRNPKSIIGDGVHDVTTLIQLLNEKIRRKIPQKRLPEIKLDQTALMCLLELGITPKTILQFGQKVALRPVQSSQWGGDPEDVTSTIHPENKEICIRAMHCLRLNSAGVDFISTDISVPWHRNGAVINEVNFSPVLGRTHLYQRNATQSYLKALFPTGGRIPIDVFMGRTLGEAAVVTWRKQLADGLQSFLVTDQETIDRDQKPFVTAEPRSIYRHISILRTLNTVESIVVYTENKRLFEDTGYPFENAVVHLERIEV
jgi:cyanophycin synthetase